MKTFMKSLLTASLLLAATTATAQRVQKLEDWMDSNISRAIDAKVEVQKSLGQERDVLTEGAPLKWRCDIYTFTLRKKQRPLLDEMIKAFEANGREDPYCYGVNSMTTGNPQREGRRNLMIGEDMNRYVTIGEQYGNYINVNILDANDTTKTHRYAYALEWKEDNKGNVFARYIVTYAKIPPATTSLGSSFLDLDKTFVKPGDRITIKGPARFQWNGNSYSIEQIDSLFRDAEKRGEQISKQFRKIFRKGDMVVCWADTLDHENDPVTDVVIRLQQGSDVTANDLLCDDNILLIFSKLKDQYINGNNHEFNAISIYSLCKRACSFGYFKGEDSKGMLKQLKDEIRELISTGSYDKAVLYYLQHALLELEMIK